MEPVGMIPLLAFSTGSLDSRSETFHGGLDVRTPKFKGFPGKSLIFTGVPDGTVDSKTLYIIDTCYAAAKKVLYVQDVWSINV